MSNSQMPVINTDLKAKHISPRHANIVGIVLHDTAGSGTHNDTRYLANPGDGRKVSVDFTVERDGSIWQLNPSLVNYACAHAGRNTNFKGLKDAAVNHGTIGIEIAQKADLSLKPLYTEAQVKAVADLCAWLCKEFSLDKSDITTHRQIVRDGSRSDPRSFPFENFWKLFHAAQGNAIAPKPCLHEDNQLDTIFEQIQKPLVTESGRTVPDFSQTQATSVSANDQSPNQSDGLGKIQETVTETIDDGTKQIEKSTTEITDKFDPLNLPAYIPRFGKQWFLSLIPGIGFLSTITAWWSNAPQWLIFLLGFLTGVAVCGFFALAIKFRVKVLDFVMNCYLTTADPRMHNLIPTNAKGFVGSRSYLIKKALEVSNSEQC